MAYHAHAQVNPSGYVGTGRGLAPYPAAAPALGAQPAQEVTTGGADRTVPATAPAVHPTANKPAAWYNPVRIGLGTATRDIGVLGHRL